MEGKVDFTANLKPHGPGGAVIIEEERAQSAIDMNLSRPERYHLGLARAKKLRRMADQYSWSDDDYEIAKYLIDDISPYTLHTTMFRQTLREQTSDEQREYWLARHGRWEIIGCYAQTELGHGSNVKGIETEAKWDPKTKEFVLHSPTLTASKWWNGSMGRTANHAIVVAQLLIPEDGTIGNYINYGPHPFVVQIRDMKTHQPLDGIAVGDIGPKFGYAPMDNGYMLFDHYRIPHSSMLSRYARVNPDTGEYTKPENPNVIYGSLTFARTSIVMHARLVLARAVTVAVRYSSIRRQFKDRDAPSSAPETAVLDYSTVQIRILPLLATTFALHYSGRKMKEVFYSTRKHVDQGDFSGLIELHSLSSGLKSLCTDLAAGGIEICRRAMGGHGYGGYSGLVQINADYLSKPTVEGDNWMITQQVSRYLIKMAKKVVEQPQKLGDTRTETILREYLANKDTTSFFDVLNQDDAVVKAFEHRAAYSTISIYRSREIEKQPWNDLLVTMHELSHAHSRAILVYNFYSALLEMKQQQTLDAYTQDVLWNLFRLFALNCIQNDSLGFLASGAISQEQLQAIPKQVLRLMRLIRPHAVRLVDAWAIPDYLLDSALGRSDGNVYEDIFNRAHRLNPLNKITYNPDYHTDEIVLGSGDGGKILAKL
ncbi:hypothetical protein B7463_g5086, partial [Scytalidium lignicola]